MKDNGKFGQAIASAGDVNGDGYDDVIIGASKYSNGETNEGRAYVYYGSAAGLSPSPAWTTESDQADAWYGYAVDSAGDVNDDGYDNVIVSAIYYDNGETNEGRAYVYLGSAAGLRTTAASPTPSVLPATSMATASPTSSSANPTIVTAIATVTAAARPTKDRASSIM